MAVIDTVLGAASSFAGGGLLALFTSLGTAGLKLLGAKGDRDHEFRMAQLSRDAAKDQQAGRMAELRVQTDGAVDLAEMQARIAAVTGQSRVTGHPFIDFVSQTLRPFVTYWWMGLYTAYKWATLKMMADVQGVGWTQALALAWGPQEWAVLSMILGFWFVDRHLSKRSV